MGLKRRSEKCSSETQRQTVSVYRPLTRCVGANNFYYSIITECDVARRSVLQERHTNMRCLDYLTLVSRTVYDLSFVAAGKNSSYHSLCLDSGADFSQK